MHWQDRISSDPGVCHGSACVKGTRVLVSVVVDSIAAGDSVDAVASAYRIDPDDVRAALRYAAELTRERVLPTPGSAA